MSNQPKFDMAHTMGLENLKADAAKRLAQNKSAVYQRLSDSRTVSQNRLSFELYTLISRQVEDQSIEDVRYECKLNFGVPLMCAANVDFANDWFDGPGEQSYEKQLRAMRRWDVTSEMNKETFSQYVDDILRFYSQQGIALADPRQAGY